MSLPPVGRPRTEGEAHFLPASSFRNSPPNGFSWGGASQALPIAFLRGGVSVCFPSGLENVNHPQASGAWVTSSDGFSTGKYPVAFSGPLGLVLLVASVRPSLC